MGWLWELVLAHYIDVLIAAVGAGVLARLRATKPKVANVVLFGLAGFVLTLVGLAALKTSARTDAPLDIANIEDEVLRWAHGLNWTTKRVTDPDAIFALEVASEINPNLVRITRPTRHSNLLIVAGAVHLEEPERSAMGKWPQEKTTALIRELQLELARSKIEFTGVRTPVTVITLHRLVPIHSSLRDLDLASAVHDVQTARIIASVVLRNHLDYAPEQAR